jgi:hypothetical protein
MSGQVTTRLLYTRERTPIRTEKEAASASEPVRIFWEREKSLSSIGIRIPDRPAYSLVSVLTTISRLPEQMAGLWITPWWTSQFFKGTYFPYRMRGYLASGPWSWKHRLRFKLVNRVLEIKQHDGLPHNFFYETSCKYQYMYQNNAV